MIKKELDLAAIESYKPRIYETKFIILRQELCKDDSEFIHWVEKVYNEHRNNSPGIEWKLDKNLKFVVIITYNQLKEN